MQVLEKYLYPFYPYRPYEASIGEHKFSQWGQFNMLIYSAFPTRQRQLMLFVTRWLNKIYLLSFTNVIQGGCLINYSNPRIFNLIGHTFRALEKLEFRHAKNKISQSHNASAGMYSIYLQISRI